MALPSRFVRSIPTVLICLAPLVGCGSRSPETASAQTVGASPGEMRTYYVAAEEVPWDYAPSGIDQITGAPFGAVASLWTVRGPEQLGRVYKKALFREYSDDTFRTLKPRSPEWEHLGFLGPLLRAEVGDTIRVVFRNNTRRPVTLHPHGVFYKKDAEGAPYNDRTTDGDRADDGVRPGGQHTYEWPVRNARVRPSTREAPPSGCITRMRARERT